MMTATSSADGAATETVLRFPDGIPGFPRSQRFVLRQLDEDSAFQLFESLDEPDVAMVVVVPWLLFPEYEPELGEEEQRSLQLQEPDDAMVLCPVTLDQEHHQVFVNLAGPLVVNRHSGEGRQVVLTDPELPLRAPVSLG